MCLAAGYHSRGVLRAPERTVSTDVAGEGVQGRVLTEVWQDGHRKGYHRCGNWNIRWCTALRDVVTGEGIWQSGRRPGPVLTELLKYLPFFKRTYGLKIHLNLPKLVMLFIHYLIASKFKAADEITAKVQHQFQKVKMDFKTIYLSTKKLPTEESQLIQSQ